MCLLNNNSIFSVKCQSNLQIPTNLFFNFRKELSLILTGKYHLILKKIKPPELQLWGFIFVIFHEFGHFACKWLDRRNKTDK